MSNISANNKRIAKNTLLLYIRTAFLMVISLYTSRVVLKALGVEDYGIYNVVGGVVMMFSVISNSLSSAISRFITFEIGRGDNERLRRIFSTGVIIQIVLSAVVIIAVEGIAIWFLETQMQVPEGRMDAARWVLQFSLITFCINLISVPYNACIIAHEHMKAFAYVSILEAILKLGVCFCIMALPSDRLITYAALLTVTALIIRLIYGAYCHKHFEETRGKIIFDKSLTKEMAGFSGWSFFTNTNSLLNNQGVNMLMNVYFGVTVNAARGIANQVEYAVLQFVNNFTTAINPQITKSFAAGEIERTHDLVCRGAKFSYLAMLIFAVPLICETETILNVWLVEVPDYAVIFTQLSLILGMVDCLGSSGFTASMASGKIKKHALVLTPISFIEFPLTWIFFACGASVVWTYYLYIFVKVAVMITRTHLLEGFIGLRFSTFYKRTLQPSILATIAAAIPVALVVLLMPQGILRFFISMIVGFGSAMASSFYIGMTKGEREVIGAKAKSILYKFIKHS